VPGVPQTVDEGEEIRGGDICRDKRLTNKGKKRLTSLGTIEVGTKAKETRQLGRKFVKEARDRFLRRGKSRS